MTKLSIITICLNDKEGLEKTMNSVFLQTYKDFEFIIIDGASVDGSKEVLKSSESKIAYWVSEKDKGIYHAMNKGILKAVGEYCLFLNSGDYLNGSHVLENVFNSNIKDDIVYGDMMIDRGNKDPEYGKQPDKISFEFMVHSTIWHPVAFIKRELFSKFGPYNENFKIVSDYEFFVKTILVNKATYLHLPFAISVFNTRGIGSDHAQKQLHEMERNSVLKKYFVKEKIDSAKQYNLIKYSRISFLAEAVKGIPVLLKFISSNYSKIKRIKSNFSK